MKISKIDIKDFGKFTDSKVIDDIDPRIVVFYGENEAGKTTLFNLIKTMFYGFYPATAQNHPYSSWKNERIEFTAHIDSQEEIVVYRKLLSKPSGEVKMGDKQIKINNDTLPIAKHISKELYDKIYSLRVEDLTKIQGRAWEEVEDKLLANYGTDIFKNTRDVLKDLKEEYSRLWKNDRRTKTLAKELEKEKKELNKLKKEASIREADIKKSSIRLDKINYEIDELKDKKLNIKIFLNKAKKLMPAKKIIDQINYLKSNITNKNIALTMPENIREKLQDCEEALEEINQKLNSKINSLEEKRSEKYIFTPEDELILKNKIKINLYTKSYSTLEGLTNKLNTIKNNIDRLKDRIIQEASNTLTTNWEDGLRHRFNNINKSELQVLTSKYRNTQNELRETKLKLEIEQSSDFLDIKFSKIYLVAVIIGLILACGGIFTETIVLTIVGLLGAIYGSSGIFSYINMKNNIKNSRKKIILNNLQDKIDVLNNRLKQERKSMEEYLIGIPISSIVIDNIDDMFVANLVKIKDMVYELSQLENEFKIVKNEYSEKYNEFNRFLNQFTFKEYIKESEKIFILNEEAQNLERRKILNEKLDQEIKDLSSEVKGLEKDKENLKDEIDKYIKKLKSIGEGDIDRGVQIVEDVNKTKTKIESLEEDLSKVPNVQIIIDEINRLDEEEFNFTDYEIAKAEDEQENINNKLNELSQEKVRLEEKIKSLSDGITLDEIESKIEIIDEDLQRVKIKRDKLAFLYEVIKYADQKFREENQPDVLKNASKYFEIITNGKYTDIFIEETEDGNAIAVKKSGDVIATRIRETFSRGTMDQLYLSLRLSLIDHLDREKARLPICFDELLVNWDENRLESSLKLIEEISTKRQIFIFTCHEWLAEKIEKYFGVKRIEVK